MEGLSCFCVGGVFVAFLVVILVLASQHTKKVEAAWSAAARELGFAYAPGSWKSHRGMHGAIEGRAVEISTITRGSGKHKQTYTRFEIAYGQSLGLGLRLTRQGFFSGVAKFFGGQDIEVGDAEFDENVVVKGRDPRRVIEFLTPARRFRIHRILATVANCDIADEQIVAEVPGAMADGAQIVSNARRLAHLATCLVGREEAEDRPIERALAARREGKLQEALEVVETAPVVDARVLEGEILYMAGRPADAAQAFEKARQAAPHDPEVKGWAEQAKRAAGTMAAIAKAKADQEAEITRVKAKADAEKAQRAERHAAREEQDREARAFKAKADSEAAAARAKADAAVRRAEKQVKAAAAGAAVEAPALCAALFDPKLTSSDANKLFEERYQDAAVRWSGKLARADSFSFDLIFGSKPGTKAVFEVHEVAAGTFGGRKVQAVVQLPPEAAEALRIRGGQTVAFSGRLVRCDGFMRNLYVADGVLT